MKFLIALLALFLVAGCQTTKKEPAPYPAAASKIPFSPMARQAAIQAGEGAYPNLFTGASYAVWDPQSAVKPMGMETMAESGGSDPMEKTPPEKGEDAAMMEKKMEGDLEPMPPRRPARQGPLVIECMLESLFPDRSIAYDVVGLRGIDIHLQLPDGQEILPVQKTLNPDLGEAAVGALRRYSRKITLHFPSANFMVDNPAANPEVKGVRLVMTGLGSTFYFEWRAIPDTLAKTEARADYQLREAVQKGYRATSGQVKRISHTFD